MFLQGNTPLQYGWHKHAIGLVVHLLILYGFIQCLNELIILGKGPRVHTIPNTYREQRNNALCGNLISDCIIKSLITLKFFTPRLLIWERQVCHLQFIKMLHYFMLLELARIERQFFFVTSTSNSLC